MNINEKELIEWMTQYVSKQLMQPITAVKPDISLYELGLDSQDALYLMSDLNDKLGSDFDPSLIEKQNSITNITNYIVSSFAEV